MNSQQFVLNLTILSTDFPASVLSTLSQLNIRMLAYRRRRNLRLSRILLRRPYFHQVRKLRRRPHRRHLCSPLTPHLIIPHRSSSQLHSHRRFLMLHPDPFTQQLSLLSNLRIMPRNHNSNSHTSMAELTCRAHKHPLRFHRRRHVLPQPG
uniref:Uncharacterized protein n=1 Tax=Schistocephalus solidus TaxID=70667 RepID=A0A0X3NLC1_SCHSO